MRLRASRSSKSEASRASNGSDGVDVLKMSSRMSALPTKRLRVLGPGYASARELGAQLKGGGRQSSAGVSYDRRRSAQLHQVVRVFVEHYNGERPRRAVGRCPPTHPRLAKPPSSDGLIKRRDRPCGFTHRGAVSVGLVGRARAEGAGASRAETLVRLVTPGSLLASVGCERRRKK